MDLGHSEFGKTKSQAWLWVVLIVGLVLVLGVIGMQNVQVPYTTVEIYQEQEPYSTVKEYQVQEPYTVQVPYTEELRQQVSETVPVLRGYGDVQPYAYKDKLCWLADYEYDVQYFDGSDDDLVYLQDIDFNLGGSTDPVRTYLSSFDRYSSDTTVGYDESSHILTVAALVCNKEKKRINGRFAACQYVNGKKVACPNTVTPGIAANKCQVVYLPWWTRGPEGKTIRLEPQAISQKFVCEPEGSAMTYEQGRLAVKDSQLRYPAPISGGADYETVYLKIDTMYYSPYYTKMFGYYAEQAGYQKPIITESGTLALPARYRYSPVKSLATSDAVTSSQRIGFKTITVTKTRNETMYRNATKTDVVTEYRTLDKKRDVVKYRSFWDDILLRLGVTV